MDVWDCGSDLARLKCRKCPNHFVDSTPICPPCHVRTTQTNRLAIHTEHTFESGLKEAMGKAKRLKVFPPIAVVVATAATATAAACGCDCGCSSRWMWLWL